MLQVEWDETSATGLLEDISEIGACLQMESPIPEGAAVELRYHGVTMPCLVKYCHYQDIGYYVGVEFLDGFRWSPGRFEPRHLLDLKQLAQ